MKLYYTPGVCSLSPHIALHEAGLKHEAIKVDLKTKKTENGEDYNTINPKSAVPFLVLDDGKSLSEGAAIVQYIADQKPESNLAPKNGTWERSKLQEWLNYIATDLHKAHSPFFNPDMPQAGKDIYMARLKKSYTYVEEQLKGKKYLMGDQFTVADGYLFTILSWADKIKLDLAQWPGIIEYQKRVAARPKVQAALNAESAQNKKAA